MLSTITQKGQITIPYPIRRLLLWKRGTRIKFRLVEKRQVVISPAISLTESLFGAARQGRKIRYVPLEQVRRKVGLKLAEKYVPK